MVGHGAERRGQAAAGVGRGHEILDEAARGGGRSGRFLPVRPFSAIADSRSSHIAAGRACRCRPRRGGPACGSTIGASDGIGLGHHGSKRRVEQCLRGSGVPFGIVRPAPFMELLPQPPFAPANGVLRFFGTPERVVRFVAARDVGAVAAGLLTDPFRHRGVTIDVAGHGDPG